MTAERVSVLSATRIVGSGPLAIFRGGGSGITGVVAEGVVQPGSTRRGRVCCCCADAMGRKSDCASNKVIARRTRELLINADTTTISVICG